MAQMETCQVCGKDELRSKLVRKLMVFGLPAGENRLLYSSYDDSFWTVDTSTEVGYVSMGLFSGRYRPIVVDVHTGDSVTEARGSYTVHSSGTVRSTTATDVSSLTNICFTIGLGPYHAQTVQSFTAVLGLCDASGENKTASRTWTVKGSKKCWFTLPVSSIESPLDSSGIYVYADVTITGTAKWWFDGMQLEDAVKPSDFLPITSGVASVRTGNTIQWQVPILCPKCARERILKPSERYGNFRTPEYVEIPDQSEEL